MKISRRLEHYLRHSTIEFKDNWLLAVVPQNKDEAVILTAPKVEGLYKYFHLQYNGEGHYYSTIEQLANACVRDGYISPIEATLLIRRYNKLKQEEE